MKIKTRITTIKVLLLFLSLFISQLSFCQITFDKSYCPTNSYASSSSVVIADSAGYYIGGTYYDSYSYYKPELVRTNLNGDTLWTKKFQYDYGSLKLIINSEAKEYVFLKVNSNLIVTKTTESGSTIWSKQIKRPNYDDQVNKIIQTSDKGFLLVGSTHKNPPSSYSAYVIKLNSVGDTIWTKIMNKSGSYNYYAYESIETSDSNYVILSYGDYGQITLTKLDATGKIIWIKDYKDGNIDTGCNVKETCDKQYIIVGIKNPSPTSTSNICVIKTDTAGNVIWEKNYINKNTFGYDARILALNSGFVVASGQYDGKLLFMKLNNNGDLLLSKLISTKNDLSRVSVLDKCTDGGYVFSGSYSYSLIKTDAFGCVKPQLISLTGEQNVSLNDNITYTATDIRSNSYEWITNSGTIVSGQGTNILKVNWTKTGLDTIKLRVHNDCGIDSALIIVNVQTCVPLKISKIQQLNQYDFIDFYVDKYEGKSPSYSWSTAEGDIVSGQGTNHIVIKWNEYGNLKVSVSVQNDCGLIKDSVMFFYNSNKEIEFNRIKLYPNPSNDGIIYISNEANSNSTLVIYNLIGDKVYSDFILGRNTKRIDLSSLPKGIYFVNLIFKDNKVSKKIILQ